MSIGLSKPICVDFSGDAPYEYITVFSDEIYSRTIEIIPLDNGKEYILTKDTVARLEARKPDNKPILLDARIDFVNNRIYVDLTPKCVDTPGITSCQIGLYSLDNKFIASSYFYIDVYRTTLSGNGSVNCGCDNNVVESSPEYQSFRVALLSVDEVQKRANMAIEQINENTENANQATASANEAAERANTEAKNAENATLKASSTEEKVSENENARIDEEQKRVTAENNRISEEETRERNENVRVANEEARIRAEAERVSAEQDRATSEENRKTAERERVTAESARTKAEEARLSAEKERVSAETARKSAETVRSDQENIRIENENARVANETARKTNETARVNNENTRKTNETSRIEAENVRLSSEEIRASAEDIREGNETVRVANENARIQNETARKAEFDTWSSEVGKISAFDKRISNIEAAVMPELVTPTVDKTVAHRKDVPENVLPFASINEIGGMSYKCNNLIPFPYVDTSKTENGITFVVNDDGSVTANGTATKETFFKLKDVVLSSGTYYLSGNPDGYSYTTFFMYVINLDDNITYKGNRMFEISDVKSCGVYIRVALDVEISNQTFRPMLNEGETALPYEPYFTGLRDAKVTAIESVGINLIPFPYTGADAENGDAKITINDDGSITVNGTPTVAISTGICSLSVPTDISGIFTLSLQGTFENAILQIDIYDSNLSVLYSMANNHITVDLDDYPTAKKIKVLIKRVANNTEMSGICYPMLNEGDTARLYAPYVKNTLTIPEAVQVFDGYGQGVDETYYNKIVWNPAEGVKKFVKNTERVVLDGAESWTESSISNGSKYFSYDIKPKGIGSTNDGSMPSFGLFGKTTISSDILPRHYITTYQGGASFVIFPNNSIENLEFPNVASWKAYLAEQYANGTPAMFQYAIAEPIETDISDYLGDDNFIGVEAGGTVTAVNEHEYDVPFEVEYMVKGGGTGE